MSSRWLDRFLFGGARLPIDLTIEPKPLMILVKTVLLYRRTCRAVVEP
jgi:hypothetical protein